MTKILIAIVVFALLALTVPWWWIGTETDQGNGVAAWIIYALAMNVVFAVAVAWMLKRFWTAFDDDEDSNSPPQ